MHHNIFVTVAVLSIAASAAAQWQQASPVASPSPRSGITLASDGASVLTFGGAAGFSNSNQTWAFNGSTWAQLTPVASPTGRSGYNMIHDPIRGVYLMYGGLNTAPFGGPSIDQTWEFDGTTWTQVFPTTTPGGLGNFGMSYDLVRQRAVIYGGTASSFFPIAESSTLEFDGTNWALITTATSPGPLERPAMCYHASIGKTVMFGGIDPQIGGVDTTWLYDGTNWTAATIAGAKPSVRTGANMAYDAVRGVSVLTGGLDPMTGAPILDSWEFDGVGWAQIGGVQPSARYGAGMAFLLTQRQVVLFGGLNPTTWSDLGDTWIYGASATAYGAGCAGSNGTPNLTAFTLPRLGQNFDIVLGNLPASSAFAFFTVGFSDQTSLLGPLPLSLAPYGMPGCTLLASSEVFLLMPASAGSSTMTTSLPNDAGFVGLLQYYQGCSIDTGANAAGLVSSNGLRALIGR
jgi:hypothetical protein